LISHAAGKMSVRFGQFIPGIDGFDNTLFKISSSEASGIDPQCRLLLETHLDCLQEFNWSSTARNHIGVFVGVMHIEYIPYLHQNGVKITSSVTTGNGMDFLIGRISYTFSLTGPCVSVHTACSSSLVATSMASNSMQVDHLQQSTASGVFLMLLSGTMSGISQLHAFARDGRCKTFDATGDGYGRGEACATFTLSHDPSVDRSGGRSLMGIQTNQSGRASALTAPHGPSQAALIRQTMSATGVSPNSVSCISSHGTGTALGDPIEIGGILDSSDWYSTVAVTSSKSFHGHTEGCAGITGSVHALCTLKWKVRVVWKEAMIA